MTQLRTPYGRKLARTNFKAIAVSLALIGAFAANEPANAALVLPVLYLPPVAPILRTPGAGQTIETNVNDALATRRPLLRIPASDDADPFRSVHV